MGGRSQGRVAVPRERWLSPRAQWLSPGQSGCPQGWVAVPRAGWLSPRPFFPSPRRLSRCPGQDPHGGSSDPAEHSGGDGWDGWRDGWDGMDGWDGGDEALTAPPGRPYLPPSISGPAEGLSLWPVPAVCRCPCVQPGPGPPFVVVELFFWGSGLAVCSAGRGVRVCSGFMDKARASIRTKFSCLLLW